MRMTITLLFVICLGLTAYPAPAPAAQVTAPSAVTPIYLPLMLQQSTWSSPFGVESLGILPAASLQQQLQTLGSRWVRINTLSWRQIQAQQGGAYDWTAAAAFEQRLRSLQPLNVNVTVVVDDYPRWATTIANSCSPLRADRYADFAAFMTALIKRYSQPPFNVHYWELGNEVDVDPRLLPADSVFGCWGNIDDQYYGGEVYGEMLKVVGPAIRRADPYAHVLLGGLLLASSFTTTPGHGHPENFLEGVLRAGAAPAFDVVAYHGYSTYTGQNLDYSGRQGGGWSDLGGPAVGKPAFLRNVMARYGVSKPLFFNETSFMCPPSSYPAVCTTPTASFYQAQADHMARMSVRTLALASPPSTGTQSMGQAGATADCSTAAKRPGHPLLPTRR